MAGSRLMLAVLVTISVLGIVAVAFGDGGIDPGQKCQCYFPNTNSYGVYDTDGNCAKLDCWIPVDPD